MAKSTANGLTGRKALLARGSLWNFVLKLISVVLLFYAELLVAGALGLAEYDLWATAVSWLTILAVLAALGMNTLVVRQLPAFISTGARVRARSVLRWTSRRMGLAALVLGALLLLGRHRLSGQGGELAPVLLVIALMLPFQVLLLHSEAALRGFSRPLLSQVPQLLLRPLLFVVLLGAALQVGFRWTAERVAVAALISLLFSWLFAWARLRSVVGQELGQGVPQSPDPAWRKLVAQLFGLQLAGVLVAQADPAMLYALAPSGQAGIYAVAGRLAMFLSFAQVAVNVVLAPLMSSLHATGARAELQQHLRRAARGIALFTLPALVVMWWTGPWLLSLFGPGFEEGERTLRWLICGRGFAALSGAVSLLLVMCGHQGVALRILLVTAVGKLLANLLLMPLWGAEGAAMATVGMLALSNGWAWLEVRRRLGFDPSVLTVLRSAVH
ncbi:MAG: hypothetical protein CMP23_12140 [Rickettsiales bacterium]|nr:hypothetical protein [Rickettsiales bacterium]